jgi:phage recombination protein Bet
MSQELTRIDVTADLPAVKFTEDDMKNQFCPLATVKEIALGLNVVKSLKLNPFLREVHFIKYSQNDKMAIVVGYEVYLKRAERTGKLNGWTAGINKEDNVSWVKIWRKDWVEPFYWEVNLSEFDKKQSTWKQIPSFMGKKVAIAQGFRMCFPDELGGMPYTPEERQVYDIEPENIKPDVSMPKAISAPAEPTRADSSKNEETGIEGHEKPLEAKPEGNTGLVDERSNLIFEVTKAAKSVFKAKNDWIAYMAQEYGCEKIQEMTTDQLKNCLQSLKEKAKENA